MGPKIKHGTDAGRMMFLRRRTCQEGYDSFHLVETGLYPRIDSPILSCAPDNEQEFSFIEMYRIIWHCYTTSQSSDDND